MITVINYSGRASELGGIVNLVDRRRSSLSRSERPPFLSLVDNTFRQSIYSGEKSPEFVAKFPREVPLFCRYLNFLKTQRKKTSAPKPSSIRPSVSTEHRLVTDTDRQTDRQTQDPRNYNTASRG